MHSKKLKALLSIFTLNLIIFYYYSSSPPAHSEKEESGLKPWPDLPSYQPWSQHHYISPQSCEGYFGNGFTQQIGLLKPTDKEVGASKTGWFRCFFSETLRSSICEGGRIRMNVNNISMSRGGERLRLVMGRLEETELPSFQDGAFDIEVEDKFSIGLKLVDQEFLNKYVPQGAVNRHTMRELLGSVRSVGPYDFKCTEWIEEPTLLITRFEYANLFHTFTDWYSAYVASRVTGLPKRPHVIFVDGHCEAPLEEMWRALFSSVRYAKHLSSHVCFRHAILTPLGYETAMFLGLNQRINCMGATSNELQQHPNDQKTARLSEFGELITASFDLPLNFHRISRTTPKHTILFIRREDYLPHPRSRGKVESRLSNEEKVFYFVRNWAANYSDCKLNAVNGIFAHMHMEEQVRAVRDARIIIGAHGAGLAHMISALPNTVVVEILNDEVKGRPHFALIAKWRGLEYHAIFLRHSYANPKRVIRKLEEIVKSIGC